MIRARKEDFDFFRLKQDEIKNSSNCIKRNSSSSISIFCEEEEEESRSPLSQKFH